MNTHVLRTRVGRLIFAATWSQAIALALGLSAFASALAVLGYAYLLRMQPPLLLLVASATGLALSAAGFKIHDIAKERIKWTRDNDSLRTLLDLAPTIGFINRDIKGAIEHCLLNLAGAYTAQDWKAIDPETFAKWSAISGSCLEALRRAAQFGELTPPWLGGVDPWWSGAWRQGSGEWWLHHEWYPFWDGLDDAERESYAERWEMPAEWRDHFQRIGHL